MKPGYAARRARVPARLRHVGRTADIPSQHPCASLCSACGYLRQPSIDGGYRVAADEAPSGGCPACGGDGWVDLRSEDVLIALSENESFAMAQTVLGWAMQSAGVLLLGTAVVFLASMLALLFLSTGALLPAGLTTIATVLTAVALLRRLYELGRPPRPRPLPMRWRYALPSPAPPQVDGDPVWLQGDPILAPLSGRPCLAYDVGIRIDDDARAPLGRWLLVEQGSASLLTPNATLPEGHVWLELRERTLHRPESPEDEERLHRFLRERGFNSPDLFVFETIVEPHAAVKASTRNGRVVIERGPLALESER